MTLLNVADAVMLGDRPIDKIYLGGLQVWPSGGVVEEFEPLLAQLRKPDGTHDSFSIPGNRVHASSNASMTASTWFYLPMVLSRSIVIEELLAAVMVAGTGTWEASILTADKWFQPISEVQAFGPYGDVNVFGIQRRAVTPLQLSPGRYLVGMKVSNATASWRWFRQWPYSMYNGMGSSTITQATIRHGSINTTALQGWNTTGISANTGLGLPLLFKWVLV